MKIGKLILQKPWTIWDIDGTHNKAGTIKYFVDLQVWVGLKIEEMKFLITDLGVDEIILRYPWLAAFQPKINWKEATIAEDMQPIVIKTLAFKMDKEVARIAKSWTGNSQRPPQKMAKKFLLPELRAKRLEACQPLCRWQ